MSHIWYHNSCTYFTAPTEFISVCVFNQAEQIKTTSYGQKIKKKVFILKLREAYWIIHTSEGSMVQWSKCCEYFKNNQDKDNCSSELIYNVDVCGLQKTNVSHEPWSVNDKTIWNSYLHKLLHLFITLIAYLDKVGIDYFVDYSLNLFALNCFVEKKIFFQPATKLTLILDQGVTSPSQRLKIKFVMVQELTPARYIWTLLVLFQFWENICFSFWIIATNFVRHYWSHGIPNHSDLVSFDHIRRNLSILLK